MRSTTAAALLGAFLVATEAHPAVDLEARDVDTRFPYKGPKVPVGDWVDQTVNGNGKGFPRLVEPPAVKPATSSPKNNINVISTSYVPNGMNVHYQTPFGLGCAPTVHYGEKSNDLCYKATGQSSTYDRTPPCSEVTVTQCSQFFHNVQIANLKPDTTYYYQIPAANGTTASPVMKFKTARSAGDKSAFSVAVLNDMGYTNAQGTHQQLLNAADDGIAFAWHGGDISYADDWYSGVLPCQLTGDDSWPVCYNGTHSSLPSSDPITPAYKQPLPKGEIPDQGGPLGGDMNVIYESNWDLWQNWMNALTTKVPYMVLPGNHEASCAEFDGPGNVLTAYLNEDKPNTTVAESALTYYSCPPSQRNFTTFQYRFRMPGPESGGVGNFWYSFDYGLTHFVSIDTETDFANSPEYPFIAETDGKTNKPAENETYVTDAGPFGNIDNDDYKNNEAYEQYQWLAKDLAAVDRTKTPWVVVNAHRPMYSSQTSGYQGDIRNAFQALFLKNHVDLYMAGHIHWYERMYPLTADGAINHASIKDNNTYITDPGVALTHVTNGMAGNIESHSVLGSDTRLALTAVLNQNDFGFSKMTFHNSTHMTWQFVKGDGSGMGDELNIIKKGSA